jgi:hypothetical protein
MPKGSPHSLAILMTLVVAGIIAVWAWYGLKSPPVQPSASIVTTPSAWKRFDTGSFNLYAPKYAVLRKLDEPGHSVGQLIGLGLYVKYEFGARANTLVGPGQGMDVTEREIVIDGRPGILRLATLNAAEQQARFGGYGQPCYIGLYLPEAARGIRPDGQQEQIALQVEGVAVNTDLRDTVEMIFKTIRFIKNK